MKRFVITSALLLIIVGGTAFICGKYINGIIDMYDKEVTLNKELTAQYEICSAYMDYSMENKGFCIEVSIVTQLPVFKFDENNIPLPDIKKERCCMVSYNLYSDYFHINDRVNINNGRMADGSDIPLRLTGDWKITNINYDNDDLIILYTDEDIKIIESSVLFKGN